MDINYFKNLTSTLAQPTELNENENNIPISKK